jgi:uncharacterized protein (DUF305 family)
MRYTSALGRLALIALAAPACRVRPAEAPAPAATSSAGAVGTAVASERLERTRRGYTLGDVRFMQGMIAHHAQALQMTALIPSRTSRQDMQLLGERISVSQRDEIAMMQRWLRERGEEVPPVSSHGPHHGVGEMTPGMLTPEEMSRLAASKGVEFERELLRLMIKHHEGALAMVARLFSTHGAGQDTQIYFFASDVDADQRAEISRMQAMLAAMSP